MGRVSVVVGGRSYALSCADGEEAHLAALGGHLAAKADELTTAIGTMSEPRLLLMAGLQIADELFAARGSHDSGSHGSATEPALAALLARVEALALTIEAATDDAA